METTTVDVSAIMEPTTVTAGIVAIPAGNVPYSTVNSRALNIPPIISRRPQLPTSTIKQPRRAGLGAGAKIEVLLKYIHPSATINARFPNYLPMQTLQACTVTKRAQVCNIYNIFVYIVYARYIYIYIYIYTYMYTRMFVKIYAYWPNLQIVLGSVGHQID